MTIPACLLLAVFADPLVRVLYGEKWVAAVVVLQFLAGLGLLRVIYQYWADVLVAVGAGARALVVQVCWIVALVPALVVAMQWGLPAWAWPTWWWPGCSSARSTSCACEASSTWGPRCGPGSCSAWPRPVPACSGSSWSTPQLNSLWTLLLGTPLVLGVYGALTWKAGVRAGVDPSWLGAARRQIAARLRRRDGSASN